MVSITLGIRYEASDGPGQWLHVHSGNLVAGDSGNDVHESVLYLPEYSPSKDWTFAEAYIGDLTGNRQSWSKHSQSDMTFLESLGLPSSFTTPKVVRLTLRCRRSSISLVIEETNEAGYDGVKITLRAEITDDLSGFDTLGIRYEGSDGPGQWVDMYIRVI